MIEGVYLSPKVCDVSLQFPDIFISLCNSARWKEEKKSINILASRGKEVYLHVHICFEGKDLLNQIFRPLWCVVSSINW